MAPSRSPAAELDEASRAVERLGCRPIDLAALCLATEAGVLVWDEGGVLLYASPLAEAHFGLILGRPALTAAGLAAGLLDDEGRGIANGALSAERCAAGRPGPHTDVVQVPGAAPRWVRMTAQPLALAGRNRGVVCATVDVTELVRREHGLRAQAHTDSLTGLPNRVLFADRAPLALARARRTGETLAVCMLDLDGFKAVNDAFGHKAGDQLLQEIARRLEEVVRREDTVARFGGDEFALLLGGFRGSGDWSLALRRVLEAVAAPVTLAANTVQVTASVGVALFPSDAEDPDTLLRRADQAMYKAKAEGKNRFHVYDAAVALRTRANRSIVTRVEEALRDGELRLHFQPQVDARAGRVVGAEALIRWEHPVLGLRSPGEFLPLVEHDDVIVRLGEWVIREAVSRLDRWLASGLDLRVSVNIAARHLAHGSLETGLGAVLAAYPADRSRRFGVEIVESAAHEDLGAVMRLVESYRKEGVSFALDDFGTGFSSLVQLKRLGVDALKIDHTFVRDMLEDPGDLAIVHGVVGLADAFGCRVVAEGVESIEQALVLMELGCDELQGYAIAPAMPAEEFEAWVRAFQPDPRWRAARLNFPRRREFDLLLQSVTHRYWLTHEAPGTRADLASCRLTRWLDDAEHSADAPRLALPELVTLHRAVHALGAAVAPGEAVAEANRALIARLDAVRASLAGRFGQPIHRIREGDA